jgi:hypothetical protein
MFEEEEQGSAPTRVTKYDILALLTSLASDIAMDIAGALSVATQMLQTQASFVEDKLTFHEYAARTIEQLQKED